MPSKWVVVGISGATCGGKTTLANNLHKLLPQSVMISQDDYFFPTDSPHHLKVESLGHVNWEVMSALDMKSMKSDISDVLAQEPPSAVLPTKAKRSGLSEKIQEIYPFILILEGFLLLNDLEISNLCDLRYYLTLTKEQCWDRRSLRVYDPPDIPGYFDQVVWPEYVKNRDELLMGGAVKVINGMNEPQSTLQGVWGELKGVICTGVKEVRL